jgi:hypothetical protein
MSVAYGHKQSIWGLSFHERGEGLRECLREGPKENYPCILIQTHFRKSLLMYEPSNL